MTDRLSDSAISTQTPESEPGRSALAKFLLPSFWILGLVMALGLVLAERYGPEKLRLIKITGIDAVSYYSVTHSLLFDQDFDLTNQYAALKPIPTEWHAVQEETGLPGCHWAIGFPLYELPFLSLGYVTSLILEGPNDGYSLTCIFFYYLGIIVSLCIGLSFLFLFLTEAARCRGMGENRSRILAFVVTLGVLVSSNLPYYSFSPLAHATTFAACSAFLFAWYRAKDSVSISRWTIVGVLAGFTWLCRWQTGLYLLIPITYEALNLRSSLQDATLSKSRWVGSRALAASLFWLMTVPQLLQWKAIYGAWVCNPQPDGYLQFPPRYIANVLFSSCHGWFLWTPAMLIGTLGLLLACRKRFREALPLLVALFSQIVLIGSIPDYWHNSQSFSIRMLVSALPIMAYGFMELLTIQKRLFLIALCALWLLSAVFSTIFAVQYRLGLVPQCDRLTFRELFTDKLFLRTALRREAAFRKALSAAKQGDAGKALKLLEQASCRYGTTRMGLEAAREIHRLLGNTEDEAVAIQELNELLETRLP